MVISDTYLVKVLMVSVLAARRAEAKSVTGVGDFSGGVIKRYGNKELCGIFSAINGKRKYTSFAYTSSNYIMWWR